MKYSESVSYSEMLLLFLNEAFDPRSCLREDHSHVGVDVKACLQLSFYGDWRGEASFSEVNRNERHCIVIRSALLARLGNAS